MDAVAPVSHWRRVGAHARNDSTVSVRGEGKNSFPDVHERLEGADERERKGMSFCVIRERERERKKRYL